MSDVAPSDSSTLDEFFRVASQALSGDDYRCPYKFLGCKYESSKKQEIESHLRLTDNLVKHGKLNLAKLEEVAKSVHSLQTQMSIVGDKNLGSAEWARNKSSSVVQSILTEKNIPYLPTEVNEMLKKFPVMNSKTTHFLHTLQINLAEVKDEYLKLKKTLQQTENKVKTLEAQARAAPAQASSNRDEEDSGYSSHLSGANVSSHSTNEDDRNKNILKRLDQLESKNARLEQELSTLRKEHEKCKHVERFVMHLHERIKSLDLGRTGTCIWKVSGFNTIFGNAKTQHENGSLDRKGQRNDSLPPVDFCSPLFYTAPQGYLMYMRLYPYGCDAAISKYVSLFVALSPGEYDGVLAWPFRHMIEISLLSQVDAQDKWTQVIVPGGNNLKCFQRPSAKGGNMSVGILHFIVHGKLFDKSSNFLRNDQLFIELRIKDIDLPISAKESVPTQQAVASPPTTVGDVNENPQQHRENASSAPSLY